jgi:Ca2+-dependent lipid-binding protein
MGKDLLNTTKNSVSKLITMDSLNIECYRKYPERKLSTESGTITLRFTKGKNLVSADSNGKISFFIYFQFFFFIFFFNNFFFLLLQGLSDPYVKIEFQKQTWKSKIQKKTLNPVWNETCKLKAKDVNQRHSIDVYIYDHDLVGKKFYLFYLFVFFKFFIFNGKK